MPPSVRCIHATRSWAMQKQPSRRNAGGRLGRITADAGNLGAIGSSMRRGPIQWLVVCGVVLISAIVIGTAVMVGNFRERALNSSERELENTVLLLARHFDQELDDFTVIQKDIVTQVQRTGISSPDVFRRQLATPE